MRDRERIEELEEEVRQLRALLAERTLHQWPHEWGLTPVESRFLSAIATAPSGVASKRYVYGVLYHDRDPDDQPCDRAFDVFTCKIRKKLPADQAARLVTHHGVGWSWKKDPAAE